jgi:hypothetical protein
VCVIWQILRIHAIVVNKFNKDQAGIFKKIKIKIKREKLQDKL